MVNSTASHVALNEQLIQLNAHPADKKAAIEAVGALLVQAGMVKNDFIHSMMQREAVSNTYLGSGVAIPHGLVEDKGLIEHDAIAVLQVPGGVEWNDGQKATLIVAIAAKSDTHITILRQLTRLLQNESLLAELSTTDQAAKIIEALTGEAAAPQSSEVVKDYAHAIEWTVDYPSGLHARPASSWADSAKKLGIHIQVRHDNEVAAADNMVALLQLGLRAGDQVVISAEGDNAEALLAQFKQSIMALTAKEKEDAERAQVQMKAQNTGGWQPAENHGDALYGVTASPGFMLGKAYYLSAHEPDIKDSPVSLIEGGALLDQALNQARQRMVALIDSTTRRLGAGDAEIFKAQAALLEDTSLVSAACQLMVAGHGVAWSWHQAIEDRAEQLTQSGNPLLAERAADLRDVGQRVLGYIDPALKRTTLADLPEGEWILVASDLSPSDTALLDVNKVKGLVTEFGGPTSHTAILARTLGIPAVVAVGQGLHIIQTHDEIIVDGDGAAIYVRPTATNIDAANAWIITQREKREKEEADRRKPATTTDGHTMMVAANVNRPDQVKFALAQGAEGVGLMRTEFLFLERGDTPSEEEQYETYQAMIAALDDAPLIIRALDIGGDKQVAHLKLPHEENPFLGVRGARLLLRRLDLLLPQLKAIYRAAKDGKDVSIMFPMITSVAEITALKAHCEEMRIAVDGPNIPIGIMVEVPAAALMADVLAEHVDFFSIGTNDLTQYTLAMDRQNPDLAPEADSLHPAVLRLIEKTVQGAKKHQRHVGVCGGLAGDPLGALLLMGLGVDELSMTPRDIASVKARIRQHSLADMQAMAAKAITFENAAEVRALTGDMA